MSRPTGIRTFNPESPPKLAHLQSGQQPSTIAAGILNLPGSARIKSTGSESTCPDREVHESSFQELAFTPLVKEHQKEHGSRRQYERMEQSGPQGNGLGRAEQDFIRQRDSFYMASVSETGWPYVQHRGGPKGFVRVMNPGLLGFADLRGNRQYVSLGNLEHDPRVALFFMDYPNQTRLKILGRVEVHEHDEQAPALIESFRPIDKSDVIERVILIHVEGFDWNCPQHITPRYTIDELQEVLAPVREKLATIEAENAALRDKLSLLSK